MRSRAGVLFLIFGTLTFAGSAQSAPVNGLTDQPLGSVTAGQKIVTRDCGGCHAVGRDDLSKLSSAPAFRTLGQRYAVAGLAEALAEGISVGHPAMPAFEYPADQVADVIAYLTSIQVEAPKAKPVQ